MEQIKDVEDINKLKSYELKRIFKHNRAMNTEYYQYFYGFNNKNRTEMRALLLDIFEKNIPIFYTIVQ